MKHNKTLIATAAIAFTAISPSSIQAEDLNAFLKESSMDISFRYRAESSDVKGGAESALANTLKSRLTFNSGSIAGFSALVEGDNVYQLTDKFYDKDNGNTASDYDLVLDQETTQINQAYVQYSDFNSTIKAGNQRIVLDNQRHVGGVAFRQDEATFDAISILNNSISNTTVFAAVANNRNDITNKNTEESITLLNVKYDVSKDISASAFYYSIADTNGTEDLDFDTFGIRSKGSINDVSFEAELASQNKTTAAGGDFTSQYYQLSAATKLGAVKTTLGYEAFTSDNGLAAFATPLGTNHKFFGWSDAYLTGAGNNGIQDIYASALTKVSGVKLVAQLHKFDAVEGNSDLGTEMGFIVAKKLGAYGASLKFAQLTGSDTKSDVTKIWLTATAQF